MSKIIIDPYSTDTQQVGVLPKCLVTYLDAARCFKALKEAWSLGRSYGAPSNNSICY